MGKHLYTLTGSRPFRFVRNRILGLGRNFQREEIDFKTLKEILEGLHPTVDVDIISDGGFDYPLFWKRPKSSRIKKNRSTPGRTTRTISGCYDQEKVDRIGLVIVHTTYDVFSPGSKLGCIIGRRGRWWRRNYIDMTPQKPTNIAFGKEVYSRDRLEFMVDLKTGLGVGREVEMRRGAGLSFD